jgi:hypothetical protein
MYEGRTIRNATEVFAARRLVLAGGLWPVGASAHDDQTKAAASQHDHGTDQRNQSSALVRIVRESTERFRDVGVAEAEGYGLLFGCVSGSDAGAMGMHFVNGSLIGDDVLDPTRPEIVIYEPTANGRLRLIGADFLVFAEVRPDRLRARTCRGLLPGPAASDGEDTAARASSIRRQPCSSAAAPAPASHGG